MDRSRVTLIVVHRGNQRYLRDALACARTAGNEVVLIGDETNQRDSHWVDYQTCRSELYDQFLTVYEHMSTNPYKFELICFERYFLTYTYMKQNHLVDCVMMDSDICLYEKITRDFFGSAELAISIPTQKTEYTMSASAHFSYWKIEALEKMLDFLQSAYQEKNSELYKKWKWHCQTGTPGGICDMTLLYLFAKQYQGNILNTDEILSPRLFDQVMSDFQNHDRTFMTMRNGHTKAVFKNQDQEICYQTTDHQLFPVLYIHAQGGDKRYIYAISKKRTAVFWLEIGNGLYWLNRIYEKIMRCMGKEKRFNWK